jgi:heme-degrading monooxygenase HmoA
MIVCLRTVIVPAEARDRYLAWITDGQAIREAHGLLAEWVSQPLDGGDELTVVTVWPSHDVFDAWIATPERDALTDSDVHRSVEYRPITRCDAVGGYTATGLALEVLP